jgi:hypothetical protein
MGTTVKPFTADEANFQAANVAPVFTIQGTNGPVRGCDCNGGTTDSTMFFVLDGATYASGTFTVDIYYFADTATTGQVKWGAAFGANTANSSTQDVTTDTFATETTGTLTHPGTTARREQKITLSSVSADSGATGDTFNIRVRRLASDTVNDNLSGSVYMTRIKVTYTSV